MVPKRNSKPVKASIFHLKIVFCLILLILVTASARSHKNRGKKHRGPKYHPHRRPSNFETPDDENDLKNEESVADVSVTSTSPPPRRRRPRITSDNSPPGFSNFGSSTNKNTCQTRGCLNAAEIIKAYMDESYSPCKNFYAFACGSYVKQDKTPPLTESLFTIIDNRTQYALKRLLSEDYNEETEPRTFSLVKKFYKTCENTEKFESDNEDVLKSIIKELGGWPVVEGDDWDETNFSWVEMDIKLRSLGFPPKNIFHVFVHPDPDNPKKNALFINSASTFINRENLNPNFASKISGAYEAFMKNIAINYFNVEPSRAIAEMKEVYNLEVKLAKLGRLNLKKEKSIKSIADLKNEYPDVPWQKYINGLVGPDIYINETDPVIRTDNPFYFSNLKKVFDKTDSKIIANYMIWRTIAFTANYLTGKIQKIFLAFTNIPDRWRECLRFLSDKKSGLPVALSSLYVKKYFDNQAKESLGPVLNAIIKEFQETLKQSKWMDDKSKEAAIKKSDYMKKIIAYPEEILNDKVMDDYTRNLNFDDPVFLKNVLNLNSFHYNQGLSGLLEQPNQSLVAVFPDVTSANALYNRVENAFAILAGVLQSPIFNVDWPNYAKFGSIGFIIGHEIMHAFDSRNIEFDASGRNKSWISPKAAEEYQRKVDCFVDQYSKYVDKTISKKVNGSLTLNENIADNIGLNISFNAYKNWEMNNPNELPLPDLNYTNEQVFWITSVHFLCARNSESYRVNALNTDPHTLQGFRTRGSVSNSKDFAKAFNCPLNTLMNPAKKCTIW